MLYYRGMGANAWFASVAEELSARDSSIEVGRMLRSVGIRWRGQFVAALTPDGALALKLPSGRVCQLVESGTGREFRSGSRVMREWMYVTPGSKAAFRSYVEEALAHARSVPSRTVSHR